MSARFLPAALLLLGACAIDPGNSDGPESSSNPANASSPESAKGGATASNPAKGGAAGSNGETSGAVAKGGAAANSGVGRTDTQPDAIAGSAGEALDPTAVGSTGGQAGEPRAPCDLEGHCDPKIVDEQFTCGVVSGNECEFAGFVGATAQVSPGQRVVIGTACCGACECVPVEVYFDGDRCWQGMSRCSAALVNPHPTTTPNPAFTPSTEAYGSFYLGSAGSEGRETSGGAGGTGSAGSGGGGASGSAGTATSNQGGGGSSP
jgi:hypothetical protein